MLHGSYNLNSVSKRTTIGSAALTTKPYKTLVIGSSLDDPIQLFVPELTISRGSTPELINLGPTFEMRILVQKKRGPTAFGVSYYGDICVRLDSSPRCLGVMVNASFGPGTSRRAAGRSLAGTRDNVKMKFLGFTLTGA